MEAEALIVGVVFIKSGHGDGHRDVDAYTSRGPDGIPALESIPLNQQGLC